MIARLRAAANFLWDFIVGDDWRIAAAVVIGVGLTAALHHAGVAAWWLMPVLVAAILTVSVRSLRRS
jgi:hypothetical protein